MMESAEDRPGNNVLGRNTPHGRQPMCAERWLHAKTSVWSAMIVATVFLQNSLGVDIVGDDDVIEAIAA